MMDHAFASRSFWANDNKFLQDANHATDVCTSVVVTHHIPRGTSFGPCLLQSTFYDTIAFIALKSRDRIAKSYVFRVSSTKEKYGHCNLYCFYLKSRYMHL